MTSQNLCKCQVCPRNSVAAWRVSARRQLLLTAHETAAVQVDLLDMSICAKEIHVTTSDSKSQTSQLNQYRKSYQTFKAMQALRIFTLPMFFRVEWHFSTEPCDVTWKFHLWLGCPVPHMQEQQWLAPCTSEYPTQSIFQVGDNVCQSVPGPEWKTQKNIWTHYETNLSCEVVYIRPGWSRARSTGAVVEVADSNTLTLHHSRQNVIGLWKTEVILLGCPADQSLCVGRLFAIHDLASHGTFRTSICMAQTSSLRRRSFQPEGRCTCTIAISQRSWRSPAGGQCYYLKIWWLIHTFHNIELKWK